MKTVITIGREYGSGGRLVAKKLSEALDIPFYDKEVIQGVVKKTGFAENFVRDAERRPTNSFIYDLYFSAQSLSTQDQVFIAQSGVIKDLASKGGCVIVGRCGDYILREYDNVFRVFIHANKEARIKRILSKGLCDEKKVSDFITKRDKQRANYYNFYSNKRWDDLSNYHLTIDSSEFDIDEVAEIIITAIGKIKPPAKK